MPLQEAAVSAIEKEQVRTEIAKLFQTDDTLYAKFRSDVKSTPIAYSIPGNTGERGAFRVPMAIAANGNMLQITGDGDDMGVGGGTQWKSQVLGPVTFVLGTQITWLAENATDSKSKALIDVNSAEFANSLDYFKTGLESQLQGDGTGSLLSLAGSTITLAGGPPNQVATITGLPLSSVNQVQDFQTVQFFSSASGGVNQGVATVSFTDAPNGTINFSTIIPAGVTAASFIFINASGAALVGAAGSSLMGIHAYQSNAAVGTLNGLNRALYPGRLSTPTVNLANNLITVPYGRRGLQLLRSALGSDTPALEDLFWYTGLSQEAAIEDLNLQVTVVNRQEVKGDAGIDMGYKQAPSTFLGREILVSTHAQDGTNANGGGRIDGICPKYWAIGEMKSPDLYEVKGMSVFPMYGASGGVATAHIFYYICSFNVVNSNPRAGVVFTNCGVPVGY
jgi:hypothetical protein